MALKLSLSPKALPPPSPVPSLPLGKLPCLKTVGKRAAGTSPPTSRQPAGAPDPVQRLGQLRRSPSERGSLLPRLWAPRVQAAGG